MPPRKKFDSETEAQYNVATEDCSPLPRKWFKEHPVDSTWSRDKLFSELYKPSRAARLIPVFPSHKIFVDVIDGDGRKFARLFEQTWRKIPFWARRDILHYWKNCHLAGFFSPEIVLVDLANLGFSCAHVAHNGHLIRFPAKDLSKRDWDVCASIAHELAHVVQYSWGLRNVLDSDGNSFETPDGNTWSRESIEIHAWSMVAEWGWDPDVDWYDD